MMEKGRWGEKIQRLVSRRGDFITLSQREMKKGERISIYYKHTHTNIASQAKATAGKYCIPMEHGSRRDKPIFPLNFILFNYYFILGCFHYILLFKHSNGILCFIAFCFDSHLEVERFSQHSIHEEEEQDDVSTVRLTEQQLHSILHIEHWEAQERIVFPGVVRAISLNSVFPGLHAPAFHWMWQLWSWTNQASLNAEPHLKFR